MKIIWTDGLNRDNIADRLVATGIANEREGKLMLESLRISVAGDDTEWYEMVPDDYRLSRGMGDRV